MTLPILAALAILTMKFLADVFARISGLSSLPLVAEIARAGILYPIGIGILIWQLLGDVRLAVGLIIGSAIFLLIAGVPLI